MTLIVFNGILVTVNIERLIKVKVKVVPIHLKINLNYTLMKLTFTNLNWKINVLPIHGKLKCKQNHTREPTILAFYFI